MIRTQISLSEEDYRLARESAGKLGISLAELLRRAIRLMIPVSHAQRWMRYAGLVATGRPDSSQKIDDVVYGQKD